LVHTAFRRSLTFAVALAGAIAFVPLPVQDEALRAQVHPVVTTEVAPAAFWDTTALLAEGARAGLEQSVGAWTTTSPALLQEALANWPIAETELAYSQIANALLVPLMPLVSGQFTAAVTEVLARSAPALRDQIEMLPTLVEHGTIRLLGPFLGAIGGAGAAHAEIYWATATGDIPGFVAGVAKIPGYVIDGFLNGGYGDIGPLLSGSDGRVITPPGLLTPWTSDLLGGNGITSHGEVVESEAADRDPTPARAVAVVSDADSGTADTAEDVSVRSWRWGSGRALTERIEQTERVDVETVKGGVDVDHSRRGGLNPAVEGTQPDADDSDPARADTAKEVSVQDDEKGSPTAESNKRAAKDSAAAKPVDAA
jgi:hypothetical protein